MKDDNILLGKKDILSEIFDTIVYVNRNITHITIPSNIKIISDSAFWNCVNLQSVDFSQNSILEIISDRAFRSCSKLQNIKIPDSVKTIGCEALHGCSSLKTIDFGENSNLEVIKYSAFAGSGLQSFEIPKKVTSIGYETFNSCRNLSIVKFPSISNLSHLEDFTFSVTNLRHVIVPTYINALGAGCFSGCNNLSSVEFLCDKINMKKNIFMRSKNLLIISFPNATFVNIDETPFYEGSQNCLILVPSNADIRYVYIYKHGCDSGSPGNPGQNGCQIN